MSLLSPAYAGRPTFARSDHLDFGTARTGSRLSPCPNCKRSGQEGITTQIRAFPRTEIDMATPGWVHWRAYKARRGGDLMFSRMTETGCLLGVSSGDPHWRVARTPGLHQHGKPWTRAHTRVTGLGHFLRAHRVAEAVAFCDWQARRILLCRMGARNGRNLAMSSVTAALPVSNQRQPSGAAYLANGRQA